MLTLGPNSKNVLKTRKHEITTTDKLNWKMTGQSFSNSSLSVCSNSRPVPRAQVYQAAARLCCARNVPFFFGTILGGGGRSFSDPEPPGAWGPPPVFTLMPANVLPQRLIDFNASDFLKKCQPPPTLRGGGRSCLGPSPPGGPKHPSAFARTRPLFFHAPPLWRPPRKTNLLDL